MKSKGRSRSPKGPADEMRMKSRNGPAVIKHSPGSSGKSALPAATKISRKVIGFLSGILRVADWRSAALPFFMAEIEDFWGGPVWIAGAARSRNSQTK